MRKKKKRFNILKFIVFILCIYLLYFVITYLFNVKTKNIVILNNSYYSDEKIIETAKIENYPMFIVLSSSKIKKRLEKLDLIDSVRVSKKYGFILELDINEKKVLYYNKEKDMYMCSDAKYYKLNDIEGIPSVINYIPDTVETKFIEEFKKLDKDIISRISEIEYSVVSYDNERFLFYMNDENMVYININRLSVLNKYVEIVKKLDNKNGILHLDSGNYLEIKE